MDILETKTDYDINEKVKKFRDIFKYTNKKIVLNGSATLKSQYYFSDFDFSTNIGKISKNSFYEFERILNDIANENFLYFVELKMQLKNGKKIRCKTIDKFTQKLFNKHFSDVDFIKIDIVSWIDGRFIEMSCIYTINGSVKLDIMKSLNNDINDFMNEGKYYKALKRIFNIYKLKSFKKEYKYKKLLVLLTKFFNSINGSIYSDIANVEAVKLIFKFDDPLLKQRIKSNLHALNINNNIRSINKFIKDNNKIINDNAKNIILEIY